MAIDTHAHVLRLDAPLTAERHSKPPRDVPVEEYLALLNRHGMSYGVLTAPSFYGTDNSLLLDALDRSHGRLRGTVIVDPDVTVAELEAMKRRGVAGARFNWIRRSSIPDVTDAAYGRLFATLRDVGLHVEIFLEGPKLASVLPVVRGSGARVVLDHFAAPDPARGVACAGFREALHGVAAGDTWVKLSGPYRLGGADPREIVDALLAAGGPQQLMWGSDWPFVSHEDECTYEQAVAALAAWVPDEGVRRVILADTPAALFDFPAPSAAPLR